MNDAASGRGAKDEQHAIVVVVVESETRVHPMANSGEGCPYVMPCARRIASGRSGAWTWSN